MNLKEFICHNLDSIKNDYEVTDLVAQVIEANHLTHEQFNEMNERVELDLNNYPEVQKLVAEVKRCKDEQDKLLILSSNTLDNLFTTIILARLFVIEKIPYSLQYLAKDESMLRGNMIILGEDIRFLNKARETDFSFNAEYLAHSGVALLVSQAFTKDRYALGLAMIGTIASDVPLIRENRTIYKDGKELLEDQRYKALERLLISREKRNQQLLYNNGKNYTPYNAGMVRNKFVAPLNLYLEEHSDKRFVGLLQYFFNPNKDDKKYQEFGTMLNNIKSEFEIPVEEVTFIETNLDIITIENVRTMERTFEPYHTGFNRPHFVLKNVVIENYRKFDMARGLELSFRTDHGLVKATAYDNDAAHVKVAPGDTVSLAGTLSINGFSGLPTLHMQILENNEQ